MHNYNKELRVSPKNKRDTVNGEANMSRLGISEAAKQLGILRVYANIDP